MSLHKDAEKLTGPAPSRMPTRNRSSESVSFHSHNADAGASGTSWQAQDPRPWQAIQRKRAQPGMAEAGLEPEHPIQARGRPNGDSDVDAADGSGSPMPDAVLGKMEHAFDADFSDVRVHQDDKAGKLGAQAYTRGTDIHFAGGQFQPDSPAGHELIGHELTHVVQQRQGRVSAPGQAKGAPINADPGLEAEADTLGAKAARGEQVSVGQASSPTRGAIQRRVIQRKGGSDDLMVPGEFDDKEGDKSGEKGGDKEKPIKGSLEERFAKAKNDKKKTRLVKELFESWATVGVAEIEFAITGISETSIATLVAFAPDKAGKTYGQFLVALGPTRVLPYVGDLSTANIAWLEFPSDLKAFGSILLAIPEGKATLLFARLTVPQALDMLDSTFKGVKLNETQQKFLQTLWTATTDDKLKILERIMGVRFDITVGKDSTDGKAWDAAGLRKAWKVLVALPASHVEGNKHLNSLVRYDQASNVSGYYSESRGAVAIGYGGLDDKQDSDKGDPLKGVNRFDKVVRHEVGHAVDVQVGFSNNNAKEDKFGGWKAYGNDFKGAATDMIAKSGGAFSKLGEEQKNNVIDAFVVAMKAKKHEKVSEELKKLEWWKKIEGAKKVSLYQDPALEALKHAMNDPWYNNPNGGTALGGLIFQQSYDNDWTSYKAEARARKVSQYQFRARYEWFAEAYACYTEPNEKGNGALLEPRDKDTKKWLDENVFKKK